MSKASVYFTLDSIGGKHGIKKIKQGLDALPGVLSVSINDGSGCVAVDYDDTGSDGGRIKKQLQKLGYEVLNSEGYATVERQGR